MELTPTGRKLIDQYGYNFRTLYRCKKKISARRLNRLLNLYAKILKAGEIDEREYFDRDCSRQVLLSDLHLLEDLGLIDCELDFDAEKHPRTECFIYK